MHRLGESSTPQAWEQQHREFLANGGLAPGLEGDLYFISQELFANKLHACPPPFYSQEQLSKIWKERSFAKSSTFSTMNTWKIRMALTAWPWTAGRRPTGELALPLPAGLVALVSVDSCGSPYL